MTKKSKLKKKFKVHIIIWLSVFVILGLGLVYLMVDKHVREENREKYEEVAAFYLDCLENEKVWLAGQQDESGAIYLYELEEDTPGSVVPYFSCQAAMGMLTNGADKEQLRFVEKYLNWHTEQIIEYNGIVSDYRVIEGELIAKDSYDSVDSYIALYLTLLATYVEQGGDISLIEGAQQAVEICAEQLKGLTERGLTQVSPKKEVYYFMDNLEVLEAYEKMYALLTSGNTKVEVWDKKDELTRYFKEAGETLRTALQTLYWNNEEARFEIGLNKRFEIMEFKGFEEFYPYAVAQIYPVACEVELTDEEHMQALYEQVTMEHSWISMEMEEDFEWPVLAFIAVRLGNVTEAETYLENYREQYEEDRGYPFNTSNAGWAARTYAELYQYYNEKANQGLWDMLLEKLQ